MGLVAKVLQFVREVVEGQQAPTVLVDSGGLDQMTADHYGTAGVDAPPLNSDFAAVLPVQGGFVAVAYLDPLNAGTASEGEFRANGRDSAGVIKGWVWIKGDGTIRIENASGGYGELSTAGQWNLNGHFTVDL